MRQVMGCAIISVMLAGCALVAQEASNSAGVGFVMSSKDFGDPCTQDPGGIPRIYDNAGANSADVSVKIVNTGNSNLFITGTGFVIPPEGPLRRPRVFRVTLQPGASLGIQAQTADCGWIAIIRPH